MKALLCAAALLMISATTVFASDEFVVLNGAYDTLNADNGPGIEIRHMFSSAGDYTGYYADNGARKEVVGVYEAKPSVCSAPTGVVGNLSLHYDKVQCCLSVKQISDNLVVTYVSSNDNIRGEFGVCRSHLLKKAVAP